MIDKVEITIEQYNELRDQGLFLSALLSVGVDCWDGYDIAQEQYEKWLEDEKEATKQ